MVPRWAAAIFNTFPLHTFPAAKAYSPTTSAPPNKPTLYVAPHLNRDGTLSALHDDAEPSATFEDEKAPIQQPSGWSSSDPIAYGEVKTIEQSPMADGALVPRS